MYIFMKYLTVQWCPEPKYNYFVTFLSVHPETSVSLTGNFTTNWLKLSQHHEEPIKKCWVQLKFGPSAQIKGQDLWPFVRMQRWNALRFSPFSAITFSLSSRTLFRSRRPALMGPMVSSGRLATRSLATSSSKGTTFTLHKLPRTRLTQSRQIKAPGVHFTALLLKQETDAQALSGVCSSPRWTQTQTGWVRVHRRCTRGPRDKKP